MTAEGESLRVSQDEHPELFWAVRGAGPNFGIVTSATFALHEVGPDVLAGQVIYPFDDAEALLRRARDLIEGAGDGLQCLPFTFRVPPIDAFPVELHGRPVLDLVLFHRDLGAADELEALRTLAPAVLDTVAPTAYTTVQTAFDANLPADARYCSRAHDLAALPDDAIDAFCGQVRAMTGELSVAYLEPKGGAAGRVPPDATAMGGRDAAYAFHVIAGWVHPQDDASVMAWASGFADAMAPWSTGGVYVNLIAEDEAHRVRTAFSDIERLRALKQAWDPDNLFRANHNIAPASTDAARATR